MPLSFFLWKRSMGGLFRLIYLKIEFCALFLRKISCGIHENMIQ